MPIKAILVWLIFSVCTCTLAGQSPYVFNEKFQNTSLEAAFDLLAKKYQLKFSYENLALAGLRVSKTIKAKDLSTALSQLLEGLPLEYNITSSGQILLRKALAAETLGSNEVKVKIPRKIQGTLFDAWTSQPLAYGHILCGQGEGAITDETGHFELTLEDGNAPTEIVAQYLGYQSRKTWVSAGPDPLELHLKLTPKVEQLQGMTVTARLPILSNQLSESATVLRAQGLQRLPAFVNGSDLLRNLQYLPGISAHDDLSADLSIRGGSGDENLIILDGMTLYNVTHYFGIFSLINPQVADEVKLYKNAFPAEYGGRTSAVVDIRSAQRGSETKTQAIADVNLITSSVLLDVPIGKQIRVMGAGRITNQNLASSKLFNLLDARVEETRTPPTRPGVTVFPEVISQQPELRFYDSNLKASWRPSTRFSADLNYFRGEDNYDFAYNRQSVQLIRNRRETVTENFKEQADWFNQGASLLLKQKWSTRFQSNLDLAFSEYRIDRDFSQNGVLQVGLGRRQLYNFSNIHNNHIQGWNLNWKNEWDLSKGQKLVFGLEHLLNEVELLLREELRPILSQNTQAAQRSLYAEWQARLADSLFNFSLGLRGTNYTTGNYLSPRLSLSTQLSADLQLKASWSIYQQFLYQFYHEDRYGRTYPYWVLAKDVRSFPIMTAHNFMLGANFRHRGFEFDAEFYLKNTNNVVEHARVFVGLPNDSMQVNFRSFIGTGKTVGIDLLLKKSFRDFETWIAYTLSKSTQRFPLIFQGNPFPAPNDRRHQLKWINQYRWKKLDFSLAYVFASGRPYTDLSKLNENPSDRELLSPERRISYLENYNRVDFATAYSFRIGKTNVQANLSFFNLFNHQNVKYRQYIYSYVPGDPRKGQSMVQNTVQGLELQSLDFTTSVGVVVRF
jgi:hypothetical protein